MSYKSLEELLVVADLSDDSDVGPSDASCSTSANNTLKTVDYTEVLNTLLQDKEFDSVSESAVESASPSPIIRHKHSASAEDDLIRRKQGSARSTSNVFIAVSGSTSSRGTGGGSPRDSHLNIDETNQSNDRQQLDSSQSAIESSGYGYDKVFATTSPNGSLGCRCHITYNRTVTRLMNTCGPVFPTVSSVVRRQLLTSGNIHKLAYVFHSSDCEPSGEHGTSLPDPNSEADVVRDELDTLQSSKLSLETLGISHKNLKPPEKPSILLRQRHNISTALEKLGLFKDGFITIDGKTLNKTDTSSSNSPPLSCITTNSQILVAGTLCGSILAGDIYNHNNERQFAPNGETSQQDGDPLEWQEVDKQGDTNVTYVDVLSESNWICAGYGNGTVKLLHLKTLSHGKPSDAPKTDASEGASAHDRGSHSRGFGLMADAVSSAFSGFKKSGSHVLCSTKVFSDAIRLCKFTLVDSHEEIVCANRNSVALLSYSKAVLSHNLNVNMLQTFNTNVLANDDIIDIACLRSNPQSKYITGTSLGGLVAITTPTRCVVISTRPEMSILFRVPFNDYSKKLGDGALGIFPSITWMVLNNSGDIKPLLLIMLGNRLSFTLCDTSVGKRGGAPVHCTTVAYMKFDAMVRNIRIVSRDIFAAVDVNNMLHIVQVSIFNRVMYYDIVRSFDLNAVEVLGDAPWSDKVNISSIISVHMRTIKMVANNYKKFSALVSEMFQAKRNESFFELRLASIYILTKEGIWSSEMHSWVKTVGDLTATKSFSESLAISHALYEGLVPGLLDYKAYIENIRKLILYVLHQSSAHIIRLSKLIDSACINLLEDNDDGWTDNVKVDIMSQIESLCCSMFDVCICMNMYDCLNELIYRCFATLKLERVFVKYVLLNYFQGRLDLAQLKPEIFEAIFDAYDSMLDYLNNQFFCSAEGIEDYVVFLRDRVMLQPNDGCTFPTPDKAFNVDEHIVIYEILCNHLSKLYAFCSKNGISFGKEKAVCSLSKHSQWHCFVYCPDLVGADISLALDILCSEASNKLESRRAGVNASSNLGSGYPWDHTEDLFVVRVLYSVLNSCLTFENCGLGPEDAVSNFCKVFGYITSTGSLKPSFPIVSDLRYARSELEYEDEVLDLENMDRLTFHTSCVMDSGPCIMQMLMSTSPRLLFTCLANLFLKCDSAFEEHSDILGSKIDVFNFMLNVLICCLNRLDESQSTFLIRQMLSTFVLGISVFSEAFYLDLRTQVVAVYTLMTEIGELGHDPFVNPGPLSTKELMLADGSFNSAYYFNTFCKRSDDLFENIRQFSISAGTTCSLLKMYIRKTLFAIYHKFDCQSCWTRNAHFSSIKRFCSGLIPLVCDFETRILLCEIIGDYEKIICTYESIDRDKVFPYLQQCLQCIKAGSPPSDCTVNQLLLLDPSLQQEFVLMLMNNLPRLIGVDLKSSTELLVEVFSLSNIANVFNDQTLQFSQDIVLSTLKDFPELQLMVLSALLDMDSAYIPTDEYFNQYLRLLADRDKKSICPFLKRQRSLNINGCLDICMSAGIHDAVAYLLMRAGDFESAAHWILTAFNSAVGDLEMCQRLVDDAKYMCATFQEFIAYETLELIWFGILRCLICDVIDENAGTLIDEVFNVGILNFTKPTNALLELEKYDSVKVSTFKTSLKKLLCDLECQTFMANASSRMSNTVLNGEFRRNLACNKRGVVVSNVLDDGSRTMRMQCTICKRNLVLNPTFEGGGGTRGQKSASTKPKGSAKPQQQQGLGSSNLSPFEQHLGVIYTLPSPVDKSAPETSVGCSPKIHLANLYQDRLSTFVNKKKASTNSNRTKWNLTTFGIAPQFLPGLKNQLHSDIYSLQSINIYWCGHVFHVACAPNRCPTCYSD